MCKKKFQGKIPHLHTTGLVVAIGEHGMKISPKFLDGSILRAFLIEVLIIVDVPPVTLPGTVT